MTAATIVELINQKLGEDSFNHHPSLSREALISIRDFIENLEVYGVVDPDEEIPPVDENHGK